MHLFRHAHTMKYCCKPILKGMCCIAAAALVWIAINMQKSKQTCGDGEEPMSDAAALIDGRSYHAHNQKAELHRKKTNTTTSSLGFTYHVGVMSSLKYLGTRAEAVYHTWGKETSSLSFYIGEVATVTSSVPVTVLAGINDSCYPPLKKMFALLKYWCSNYLDQYDWFVRTDDDSYIKVAFLERLLQGLDANVKYYIGLPWVVIGVEDIPSMMLNNKYCNGPIIIFSKAVMTAICPHIHSCLSRVVSVHDDLEVGRCVSYYAGVQCHGGREASELFMHTRQQTVFSKGLTIRRDIVEGMSAHAVKDPDVMYKLHSMYKQWLLTANLNSTVYQNNPFGIKSLKVNLIRERW